MPPKQPNHEWSHLHRVICCLYIMRDHLLFQTSRLAVYVYILSIKINRRYQRENYLYLCRTFKKSGVSAICSGVGGLSVTGCVSPGAYVGRTPSFHSLTYSSPLVHALLPFCFSTTAFHRFLAAIAPSSNSSRLSNDARPFFSFSNAWAISPREKTAPRCSASTVANVVAI